MCGTMPKGQFPAMCSHPYQREPQPHQPILRGKKRRVCVRVCVCVCVYESVSSVAPVDTAGLDVREDAEGTVPSDVLTPLPAGAAAAPANIERKKKACMCTRVCVCTCVCVL